LAFRLETIFLNLASISEYLESLIHQPSSVDFDILHSLGLKEHRHVSINNRLEIL